ncbi:MAG: hypothetical protein JWL59_1199 [Chthoniobacteraceae bacterium]|nr:hypothetical protein [Chthoniobacteraceae bacterium]
MKSISITTIICGTALIVAPIVQNILTLHMVASLMAQTHERVDMTGPLSNSYSSWCLFIGVCVIISGLLVGLRFRSAPENHNSIGSHVATSNA